METTLPLRKSTAIEFDDDFGLGDLALIEPGGLSRLRLLVLDDEKLLDLAKACEQLYQDRALRRIDARRCYHPECVDADGHADECLVEAREAVQS